jgi:hypothetical protein
LDEGVLCTVVTGQSERCLESDGSKNGFTNCDRRHTGDKIVVGYFKEITLKESRTEGLGRKML